MILNKRLHDMFEKSFGFIDNTPDNEAKESNIVGLSKSDSMDKRSPDDHTDETKNVTETDTGSTMDQTPTHQKDCPSNESMKISQLSKPLSRSHIPVQQKENDIPTQTEPACENPSAEAKVPEWVDRLSEHRKRPEPPTVSPRVSRAALKYEATERIRKLAQPRVIVQKFVDRNRGRDVPRRDSAFEVSERIRTLAQPRRTVQKFVDRIPVQRVEKEVNVPHRPHVSAKYEASERTKRLARPRVDMRAFMEKLYRPSSPSKNPECRYPTPALPRYDLSVVSSDSGSDRSPKPKESRTVTTARRFVGRQSVPGWVNRLSKAKTVPPSGTKSRASRTARPKKVKKRTKKSTKNGNSKRSAAVKKAKSKSKVERAATRKRVYKTSIKKNRVSLQT